MKFAQVALLSAAATLAVAEHHNHAAHHHARRGSPVEARNPAVTVVQPPVVTVYMLDGKPISQADVDAGVKAGKYFLDGNTVVPVVASVLSVPVPTSSAVATPAGGEFLQKPSSKAPSSQAPSSAAPSPSAVPSTGSNSGNGNTGAEFPSGTIPCSQFPSDYGAIRTDWVNSAGWSGIQHTPDFKVGDGSISNIATASGCSANTFCSYACPPGYQKTQWPSAQGATGQSIGGLYCNSNNMLELSRSSSKTLCEQGAGGVSATNKLGQTVVMCRTDYPGTESETIPLEVSPGQTQPVTNPDATSYYIWEGKSTSAQYYINPAGTSVSDACQWGTGGNIGNWAPVNVGVGKDKTGTTYIGLLPNLPTNPSGKLDFNVAITGAVTLKCEYKDGQYYTNGNPTPAGCTTGATGPVAFEFS